MNIAILNWICCPNLLRFFSLIFAFSLLGRAFFLEHNLIISFLHKHL